MRHVPLILMLALAATRALAATPSALGTALWTAVSEYRPHSCAQVLRIDPATLEARAQFAVAGHLGTLVHAADPDPVAAELVAGRVRLHGIPDDGRSTLYVLEAR